MLSTSLSTSRAIALGQCIQLREWWYIWIYLNNWIVRVSEVRPSLSVRPVMRCSGSGAGTHIHSISSGASPIICTFETINTGPHVCYKSSEMLYGLRQTTLARGTDRITWISRATTWATTTTVIITATGASPASTSWVSASSCASVHHKSRWISWNK